MNFVTKERVDGKLDNTYFETMAQAKEYCLKIAKDGRVAMRLRNAQ